MRPIAKKKNFASTTWHDEMVALMAEEAGVSQALIMRWAIEFLAVNFDRKHWENKAAVLEQATGSGMRGVSWSGRARQGQCRLSRVFAYAAECSR